MAIIERPRMWQRPVSDGTFVLITLDHVDCVAEMDEQARAEAAQMSRRTYLAVVLDDGEPERIYPGADDEQPLRLQFVLAGPYLPEPPRDWATVPVWPSVVQPRTGRPPVIPTAGILPWEDCQVWTSSVLEATVSRFVVTQPYCRPRFLDSEWQSVLGYMENDNKICNTFAEPRVAWTPSQEELDTFSNLTDDPCNFSYVGREPLKHFLRGLPRLRASVEMHLDVAAIPLPTCPQFMEDESNRLRRIVADWHLRTVKRSGANQPRTRQWLNSTLHADPPTFDRIIDINDTFILPEDAIEGRIERAEALLDPQTSNDPRFIDGDSESEVEYEGFSSVISVWRLSYHRAQGALLCPRFASLRATGDYDEAYASSSTSVSSLSTRDYDSSVTSPVSCSASEAKSCYARSEDVVDCRSNGLVASDLCLQCNSRAGLSSLADFLSIIQPYTQRLLVDLRSWVG